MNRSTRIFVLGVLGVLGLVGRQRGATDADTAALQQPNAKLRDDERVDLSLLPIGDGLTLARKR